MATYICYRRRREKNALGTPRVLGEARTVTTPDVAVLSILVSYASTLRDADKSRFLSQTIQ